MRVFVVVGGVTKFVGSLSSPVKITFSFTDTCFLFIFVFKSVVYFRCNVRTKNELEN